MNASPFAPHALRANDNGAPVKVAPYVDVMQSIRAIAKNIVDGPSDQDVRGIAGDILLAAGIDGRSGHTIREKAQAIHAYVCAHTVFAPDPLRKEFVVSAAGLLCLRKGLCIRVGDCDDMTGLLGALLESLGMFTRILLITYNPKIVDGVAKTPQQHVCIGVKDESGEILEVDAQYKDWIVGRSAHVNVARVVEYDPHEVHMEATGASELPPFEIITLGAAPTVPLENVPHWDRASRSYWQRRAGQLWRHDGSEWHPVAMAAGVGYVDAAGAPRDLAWDGRRYWEKRRGRWYYQEGERWTKVDLSSPLADELRRVIEADNRARSSVAGVGASASAGGDANDPRGELAATQIKEAAFTLRRAAIDLNEALRSYQTTRSDLRLDPYEASTATVKGPNDFARDADGRIVWTPAVVEYCEWILRFADHLSALADSALAAQRQVGFSATSDIQIQMLASDTLRYVLRGASAGARLVEFQSPDGTVQWTMDEDGTRKAGASAVGVGLAPIIIGVLVLAGVVTVIATYYIVSKICDTLTAFIQEKTASTVAKAVADKKITPEQGAALLKADADRKAAIAAAEAAKSKADPFANVAEQAASVVKWLVAGAGVVGAGYLVSLAIPAIRAWRAGVPKTETASAHEHKYGWTPMQAAWRKAEDSFSRWSSAQQRAESWSAKPRDVARAKELGAEAAGDQRAIGEPGMAAYIERKTAALG